MSTPVFVLKPCQPGYKGMQLFPGTTTVGRSSKTRIKSRFVSRKHVELLVEMRTCKIRYLGKHTSEVKVNDKPVEKEWVEFPLGGRLELMADPKEAFPYTLEPYSKKVLGVVPESSVPAVDVEQYQDFTGRFNCPICTDLFVEPTELDCKHLFCFKCISDVLIQAGCNNKCPSCQSKITPKRKSTILAQRGNKRSRTEGTTKYQSQAVGLVKDTIQWLVERRMCDYSDESEWRRRSGLDPLPKLASATTSASSAGSSGSGGQVGGYPYALGSDETSEVINLLSDSEGD